MVETAPLPSGFPTPADTDTLPVRAPHPLEGWVAEPGTLGEQRPSRILPGGGHVTATRTALANFEAAEAQARRMAGTIKHAATIEAERRQAEAEAEEARKGRNPEVVLRMAHTLQAETLAEIDKLSLPPRDLPVLSH
jgi:hypothetical protein